MKGKIGTCVSIDGYRPGVDGERMAAVIQEQAGWPPEHAKRSVGHMFSMGGLLMRIPTTETAERLAAAIRELGVVARVIDFEAECDAHC